MMTRAEHLQYSPSITAGILGESAIPGDSAWALAAIIVAGVMSLFVLLWLRHRFLAGRSSRGISRFQAGVEGWLWEYRAYDASLVCPELARCLGLPERAPHAVAPILRQFVHRSDRRRVLQASAGIASGNLSVDFAVRVKSGRDEFRWLHWQGAVKDVDAEGSPLSVAGICRDITLENTAEFQARLATQVMDTASDAVVVIDSCLRIVSVNASFTSMTGYAVDEVMGRPAGFLCYPNHREAFDDDVRPALETAGMWEGEKWKSRRDGLPFLARIRISRINDESGATSHFVCTFSDITQTKQAEERLEFLASHDALTGVFNRNALLEELVRVMDHANFLGASAAVLFLDLDKFKQVNDSLGQSIGDEVLRAVARRISSVLRCEDVVARAGGDEFVVVIDRVRSRDDASLVAEKIVDALRRDLEIPGVDLVVTPSIGISMYPQDGTNGEDLISFADLAMAQSKKQKSAAFAFYDGNMSRHAQDELQRENQLRHALEEDELRLHYQPIIDVSMNCVCGVEALVRWQNPDAGLLMPADFIRLAEDRGLIAGIGLWVLHKACREIAELNARAPQPVQVSVNVSSSQLQDVRIIDDVARVLIDTGLDGKLLRLELTESVIMDGSKDVQRILHELRDMGVQLALDDFGTGYSSLSYLRRFPISHLKVDKSFIRDIPGDADAASIVTTIIALAHAMGMGLTAEGVETAPQSHFLDRQGCREQQGYYFARPQHISEVADLLLPSASTRFALQNS